MATIRVVPTHDWDILQDYLDEPGGVVLIPEEVHDTLTEEQQDFLMFGVGDIIEYDFGRDALLKVERVTTKDHRFFRSVFPNPDKV